MKFLARLICALLTLGLPVAASGAPGAEEAKPPPPPPRLEVPETRCRPGRTVRIDGRRLGNRPGRIRVVGLDQPVNARIAGWSNGGISVRLPSIEGVRDGTLRIRAWSADGRRTNVVNCTFTADRATVPVKLSQFTVAACATPAGPAHDRNTSSAGLAGCAHDKPGTAGRDQWATRPLAPGWAVSRWHFEDLSADGGGVNVVSAPEKGATRIAPAFEWTTGQGSAAYHFALRLTGPKGTRPYAGSERASR